MLIPSLLLIVGAYLLGSVSPAYIIGRWLGGKDLRQYGSGTLSGSMVFEHVGRWAIVPVAAFDVFKATVPALLALWLDLGAHVAAAAGLAAAIGHNWPIFTRFYGGRGMATFAGAWLALFPPGAFWMGGFIGVGWQLGDSGPWLYPALLTTPLLANLFNGPKMLGPVLLGGPELVGRLAGAMILITLAKRLEANRRPLPPPGAERLKVILRRAFLDRDIASHQEWIRRQPDAQDAGNTLPSE
jgi:glycerol-3-phosphate acyltransferase PlsY